VKLYVFMTLLLITFFYISCSISSHAGSGQNIFSIHVSSDTTGTVVDTGTHQISESGEYELIAGQPNIGYAFSYWKVVSGEKNITIFNKDSVKAKVTNANGNAEVKAVFVKEQLLLKVVAIPLFATDSIVLSPKPDGSGKYEYGTNVIVKIVPKAGWEITRWNGTVAVVSDSVNIVITNDTFDTVILSPIKIPANVICVKHNALQTGGGAIGSSWVDAYTDLNAALAVSDGKTVWVAKGTYTTADINTPFTLHANSSVIGGFTGIETSATSRDSVHNTTILSGQVNSTDQAHTIVLVPSTATTTVLSTFTIQSAKGQTTDPDFGGVFADASIGFTIQRCVLQNNYPFAMVAGVKSKIQQCVFLSNTGYYGAGLKIIKDSVFVINSIFTGNTAQSDGAAIYVGSGGRLISINNSIINNVSVANNTTGGIFRSTSSFGTYLLSTILWGNSVTGGTVNGTQINFTDTVFYCAIQDTANGTGIRLKRAGWPVNGLGIVATDPSFSAVSNLKGVDGFWFTDDDGLMLTSGSPCRQSGGAGTHDNWVPGFDIRGKIKPGSDVIDIGAYNQ